MQVPDPHAERVNRNAEIAHVADMKIVITLL